MKKSIIEEQLPEHLKAKAGRELTAGGLELSIRVYTGVRGLILG